MTARTGLREPTSVVLDQDVQCVCVVDPSQETRVRRERNDGIGLYHEMAFECLRILAEKRVDQAEELHDPLVLPEIFVTFEQEGMILAIAACQLQLPRPAQSRPSASHVTSLQRMDDSPLL